MLDGLPVDDIDLEAGQDDPALRPPHQRRFKQGPRDRAGSPLLVGRVQLRHFAVRDHPAAASRQLDRDPAGQQDRLVYFLSGDAATVLTQLDHGHQHAFDAEVSSGRPAGGLLFVHPTRCVRYTA